MTINTLTTEQLNHAVATEVMGWRKHERNTAYWVAAGKENEIIKDGEMARFIDQWNPAENIVHAWEVLDHLAKDRLIHLDIISVDDGFMVGYDDHGFTTDYGVVNLELRHACTHTDVTVAICRAALSAVRGSK